MKKLVLIFLSMVLLCSFSLEASVSIDATSVYVENNKLHVSVKVTCNSNETQTTYQIDLDQDGVPINLPSGWTLDADHYLIYSELISCGDLSGSGIIGIELGSDDEVLTEQIVVLHSCASTDCQCCEFKKANSKITGCTCKFEAGNDCNNGTCGHTIKQIYIEDKN